MWTTQAMQQLTACRCAQELFPINVAAFNVVAINIPHIIECSVQFSAMLDILFCRFRTWSLTWFTNSVISLLIMKFSKWAFPWRFSDTGCPVLSWIDSPYLTECTFPSRRGSSRRGQLVHIPKSFLRFPWSIVRRRSTFPLLRRPRLTIILFWITWWWRFLRFPRSIITCNRFSRILISIRGPPRVW